MSSIAVILSAGSGKRFGSETPKQYLDIAGKPVLQYSVEAFGRSVVDGIIIAAAEGYEDICREIAKKAENKKPVCVITGGAERYDSVFSALKYAKENCSKDTVVMIHDGARPFINPKDIDLLAKNVKDYGAAIAAFPCTDTIKILDENGFVKDTTERRLTWAARTPQCFMLSEIYEAYEKLFSCRDDISFSGITDDAMVYLLSFPERKVKAVDTGSDNIKITSKRDLDLAKAIAADKSI